MCMITEGQSSETAINTLDTGHFLRYRQVELQGRKEIMVDSPYTWYQSMSDTDIIRKCVLSSWYMQSFKLDTAGAWGELCC